MQRDGAGRRDIDAVEARRHGDGERFEALEPFVRQAMALAAEHQRLTLAGRQDAMSILPAGDSAATEKPFSARAETACSMDDVLKNGTRNTPPTDTRTALR